MGHGALPYADPVLRLCVNIDHVATIRQARRTWEPDPVHAALEAHLGGADGITLHLREDRRHVQDDDLRRLAESITGTLNLEMAATDEMTAIALSTRPHMAMLVPEGRQEITTEGGLDVAGEAGRLGGIVEALSSAGIRTSAFIDADPEQVDAAAACGFAVCELHTGPWAEAFYHGRDARHPAARVELERLAGCAARIRAHEMQVNAGHALHYVNVQPVAALPGLAELHIGHAIVSRAVFTGMQRAVREMKRLVREAAATTRDEGTPPMTSLPRLATAGNGV